jgi:predicted transcriptional regulator
VLSSVVFLLERFAKKEIEMMKALASSGTPIKDIASMLETTRATVYRYINR